MEIINQTQINILGLLVLIVVYFNKNLNRKFNVNHMYFMMLFYVSVVGLIGETVGFVYDGSDFVVVWISNAVALISVAIPPFIVLLITDYSITKSIKSRIKYLKIGGFWIVVNLVLIVSSLYTEWIFYVNTANEYVRGDYFYLILIAPFSMMVLIVWLLFQYRSVLSAEEFMGIVLFPLPGLIGGIMQSFNLMIVSYWAGVSVGLLILYMYLELGRQKPDYVTGFLQVEQLYDRVIDWFYTKKNVYAITITFENYDEWIKRNVVSTKEALTYMSDVLHKEFHRNSLLVRFDSNQILVLAGNKKREDIIITCEKLSKTCNDKFPQIINTRSYKKIYEVTEENRDQFMIELRNQNT